MRWYLSPMNIQIVFIFSLFKSGFAFWHPRNKNNISAVNKNNRINNKQSRVYLLDDSPIEILKQVIADFEDEQSINDIEMDIIETFDDPVVRSKVFNDLSHLAFDVTAFLGLSTLVMRLASVLGRIFSIASDYSLDNTIKEDEFYFQSFMLVTSVIVFAKSVFPRLKAVLLVQLTELDEYCYQNLFKPVGVTRNQFKAMIAVDAIGWVEYNEGTILSGLPEQRLESFMYWLHNGKVDITYHGDRLHLQDREQGRCIESPDALGLIGDMQFLYTLDREKKEKQGRNDLYTSICYPIPTAKVVSPVANLLKINSKRLCKLMDNDPELATSIRDILIIGLQRNVGTLMSEIASREFDTTDWNSVFGSSRKDDDKNNGDPQQQQLVYYTEEDQCPIE